MPDYDPKSKQKEVWEDMLKRVTQLFYLFALISMLISCGGGGSLSRDDAGTIDDDTDDVVTSATVTVTITQSDGSEGVVLTDSSSLLVSATVSNGDGAPISGELVSFSLSSADLASFDNDTGTGLTNSEGVATIGLLVGTASGSGTVTATVATDDATGSAGFTSEGAVVVVGETLISLSISNDDGSIGNTLSQDSPLSVSAFVTDSTQSPIVDELVTFTLSSDTIASFSNSTGTALTNSSGIATIGLVVGQDSGSGLVTGTLSSGEADSIGFNSEGTTAAVESPASMQLLADALQLSSSGADTIQLSAIVKNAQNVLLENVTVEFSANSGASIENTQPVTDNLGTARANLSTTNNPENRIITAVASISGFPDLTQEIDISVVGTTLSISGLNSVIVGDSVELIALLEDSDDTGISGEVVSLSASDENGVDASAFLSTSTVTTSLSGQVAFDFTANLSGNYTITATALNSSSVFTLSVQEDQFSFVDAPDINNIEEDLELNQSHTLTVQWLKDNTPVVGANVSLSATRGSLAESSLITDNNGEVQFTISSDNAGVSTILAVGTDSDNDVISASTQIAFIATTPNSVLVDATPDSIGPDNQTSTISAIVRDASDNLVGNQVVSFSVFDVANGTLDPAQATTDRNGIASTVYTSSSDSANEAVVITASVSGVEGQATLTVGDTARDIVIGTGNLIESPENSTYQKEFSVFVTDADGNPVPNADVFMSVTPPRITEGIAFFKGTWLFDEDAGIYLPTGADGLTSTPQVQTDVTGCLNEDVNFNGILDAGEDTNGDGMLTPGNVATITPSVTTDENGQALVFVTYPRQFGSWARVKITARSESSGSESRESLFFGLGVAVDDLSTEGVPPPSSPQGVGNNCFDLN